MSNSDHEVTIYDLLTYAGNESTIQDLMESGRVTFIKGDICDPIAMQQAMAGHQHVVHFAAESHVDRSIADSAAFFHTNCFGTNVVMDTARKCDVEKVVHIGTDEVYGSVEIGSSLETDPLDPRSPYSASKAGSDLIASAYFHTYGLPVIITRCTNNFGSYQYPEKAIPLFTTNLLQGGKVPLYGDGLHQRDWLYVDDHCSGISTVLEHGAFGDIYNIGAGNETANIDLVTSLLKILNLDNSSIEYVADRPGHDRRYSVDTSKIRALGWSKVHSIDSALEKTVNWYRDNEWWWGPLRQRNRTS
jgi:dTDP-glucose 4,6-dehydratase